MKKARPRKAPRNGNGHTRPIARQARTEIVPEAVTVPITTLRAMLSPIEHHIAEIHDMITSGRLRTT